MSILFLRFPCFVYSCIFHPSDLLP